MFYSIIFHDMRARLRYFLTMSFRTSGLDKRVFKTKKKKNFNYYFFFVAYFLVLENDQISPKLLSTKVTNANYRTQKNNVKSEKF